MKNLSTLNDGDLYEPFKALNSKRTKTKLGEDRCFKT